MDDLIHEITIVQRTNKYWSIKTYLNTWVVKVVLNIAKLSQISELVVLTSERTCAVYRLDAESVDTISWTSWRLPFWPAEKRGALRPITKHTAERQTEGRQWSRKMDTEALKPIPFNVMLLRQCYLLPHLYCVDNRLLWIYFKKSM